jgi:uncharacterized protein (DUF885 family)
VQGKRDTYPFTSGEQVIEYLNAINARIVPQLPRLFGRLPKARFEIRPTDPAIAGSAPAQYYPPSDDGRPGVFAMPIPMRGRSRPSASRRCSRTRACRATISTAASSSRTRCPNSAAACGFNAFGEGWGLYAESLGHELGLYERAARADGALSSTICAAPAGW